MAGLMHWLLVATGIKRNSNNGFKLTHTKDVHDNNDMGGYTINSQSKDFSGSSLSRER